ncbi:MAG: hypothetical protein ABR969_09390 [Sedimentisphaerales bacterium]|jgi:membrane protein YqaA with SNARE-associated domain
MNNNEENLRKEYDICFENWRFFVGLRFTVLAFFLTLNSGLFYIFLKGEITLENFKWLPPIIGLFSVIAGFLIENRTKQMYYACIQRAKKIEVELAYESNPEKDERIPNISPWGQYKRKKEKLLDSEAKNNCIGILLDNRCPTTIFSSQTWGIRIVYFVLIAAWVIILFVVVPDLGSKLISAISSVVDWLEFWLCIW